ncbi:MAG: hypothetical protein AB8G96_07105 [Phycisphaerales bacterium]
MSGAGIVQSFGQRPGTTRVGRIVIGCLATTVAFGATVGLGGCGAETAEASTTGDVDVVDWAREMHARANARPASEVAGNAALASGMYRDGSTGGAVSGGGGAAADDPVAAIVVTRSAAFATRYAEPPADRGSASDLSPEEIALSFAMYTTARRWDAQWPLLSQATQAEFTRWARGGGERIGTSGVRRTLAASDPVRLWASGADVRVQPPALDVSWRTTAGIESATVEAWRDGQRVDRIKLVREAGAWRLDLRDRIGR